MFLLVEWCSLRERLGFVKCCHRGVTGELRQHWRDFHTKCAMLLSRLVKRHSSVIFLKAPGACADALKGALLLVIVEQFVVS